MLFFTIPVMAESSLKKSITNDDAVQGLKEALVKAATSSSQILSKEDAYYKNPLYFIDMPKDAENLIKVVSNIPGGKEKIDEVVLRLNRTAESAAKEIIPIFKESVLSMSFDDAFSLVAGTDTAATEYLKKTTYENLVSLYKPKINDVLDQKIVGEKSTSEAWTSLVTTYNKAGAASNKLGSLFGKTKEVTPVETDLAQYATEKALDAVFIQMGEEEKKIRGNPAAYASSIIQKIFSK